MKASNEEIYSKW